MAKQTLRAKHDLVIYEGHQYWADRLPVGVKIGDTTPADEWFEQNRHEQGQDHPTYVPPRRQAEAILEGETAPERTAAEEAENEDYIPDGTDTAFDIEAASYEDLKTHATGLGLEYPGNISKADIKALIQSV